MNEKLPSEFLNKNDDTFSKFYNEFMSIKDTENLEIEGRIGTIIDKFTNNRIKLNCPHPIILKSNSNYRFQSGVTQSYFEDKICKLEELNFSTVNDRVVLSKGIRYLYEGDKLISCQKKYKEKTIDIYLPGSVYDIRISFNREISVESEKSKHFVKNLIRNRKRKSFLFHEYSLDFTVVENECKDVTNEIEVEVKDFGFSKLEFLDILINLSKLKK
ncbi:beta chain of mRNA capping enzyme [Hamiltosporidium magnivora]|uniref:mRNA-capping enzyme subunit beta n=1 Tax=Hamiltosporidium magnivora TaxID=148818 RepID=A0A4Q9LGY1_9MICR|nr:beta chain of mRNA capping enzyme [Hamiltosporidium magnivora]